MQQSRSEDKLIAYSRAEKGHLRVDSARLPCADRSAIVNAAERDRLTKQLFRTVQSTAMNRETGAAKAKSLRLEQVAIPLRLEFEVTGPEPGWQPALERALPLIRSVGQKRTRGLGRARLRCVS